MTDIFNAKPRRRKDAKIFPSFLVSPLCDSATLRLCVKILRNMHDTNLLEDQPIAWTPTPDVIERAQLTKFMKQVGVSTWDELYEFSIRDVEKFTEEVLEFLDIKFDPPYEKLLDTSNGIEFPNWFATQRGGDAKSEPGARATGFPTHAGLNITEMCLDRWQTDEMKDQPAVIWEGEEGESKYINSSYSYSELYRWVENCSAGLRHFGFEKGDAIGIHLPMMPDTVVAMLAISRIGGIAVPVFSGYGVEAIASRLNAVAAKGLITCDGFKRRGKYFDALSIAEQAVKQSPSVKTVIMVDTAEDLLDSRIGETELKLLDFNLDVCHRGQERVQSLEHHQSAIERTSAEDPLIILYTSGTTGKPKGIAHTHASFPIKAAQDMAFGTDVGKGTRISWYTDIGWMMGPWLIYGALINGATICIYDGAPDYPTPDRMWEFCAKHKVEVLGISPTLIRSLAANEESRNAGTPARSEGEARTSDPAAIDDAGKGARVPTNDAPYERHDLSSLRIFASTGEPWNPAPWWWLFEKVGNSKLPIINYSGGTEIAGGILMGNPLLPIKPCSFPAPCPGMDVDILDEDGNPVEPGKVGELVIKQPWIGMARGFWQEKERYLDTYWRRFKDIWVHGDFAMRDKDGHWFILGRSDDTLKVAGKRVGPAEVESLLVAHPQVTEAAVIGVPDEVKGTAMIAFVVLSSPPYEGGVAAASADGVVLPDSSLVTRHSSLEAELKALVAKDMGKPLAPSKIHFVSALPKTRNAKVMRRVIRSAYLGEDPGDLTSLENPQSVEEISEANR
jgi:acetyl-CoA synthetase